MQTGEFFNQAWLDCARLRPDGDTGDERRITERTGTPGGRPVYDARCSEGRVLRGLRGRTGASIDEAIEGEFRIERHALVVVVDIGAVIALASLADEVFFPQFLEFMHNHRDLAGQIVFEFAQDAVLKAGAQGESNLAYLSSLGFALSMDHVQTLALDFAKLKTMGFEPDYRPIADWTGTVNKDIGRMREIATRAQIKVD